MSAEKENYLSILILHQHFKFGKNASESAKFVNKIFNREVLS